MLKLKGENISCDSRRTVLVERRFLYGRRSDRLNVPRVAGGSNYSEKRMREGDVLY